MNVNRLFLSLDEIDYKGALEIHKNGEFKDHVSCYGVLSFNYNKNDYYLDDKKLLIFCTIGKQKEINMCDEKTIANHINCLGSMLGLVSSGLNEEVTTVNEVNKWIEDNVLEFNESCVLFDKCLSEIKLKHINISKDELKKNIKIKFSKSEFDRMGFFYCMFSLKTKCLEEHSKRVLFDGECLEININNFYNSEEQLFLGTCCF